MKMTTNIEQHRQLFPALQNKVYFNYGGQGPLPQGALDAIFQSYQYIQNVGPFSQKTGGWVTEEIALTRAAIATELSVSPDTISLTENVTDGCNIALWGIEWQSGDHILMTDCEHPGIIATVNEISRRFNVDVSICNIIDTLNQGNPVNAIAEKVQKNTKLIVLSHVLWNTGQVLPLTELCQTCKTINPDVQILSDSAQSVGMLPLNLSEINIDFYAFTGHKWWCGPEGLGGLYVKAENLPRLHPTFIGWRGIILQDHQLPWQPNASKYEVATSAYPLLAGLRTAIAIHNQFASPTFRYQQILKLSKYLWENLCTIPQIKCLHNQPPESGLVSFLLLKNSPRNLVTFLEKNHIYLRTINHPDSVRASINYLTTFEEINQLVAKIKEFYQ